MELPRNQWRDKEPAALQCPSFDVERMRYTASARSATSVVVRAESSEKKQRRLKQRQYMARFRQKEKNLTERMRRQVADLENLVYPFTDGETSASTERGKDNSNTEATDHPSWQQRKTQFLRLVHEAMTLIECNQEALMQLDRFESFMRFTENQMARATALAGGSTTADTVEDLAFHRTRETWRAEAQNAFSDVVFHW